MQTFVDKLKGIDYKDILPTGIAHAQQNPVMVRPLALGTWCGHHGLPATPRVQQPATAALCSVYAHRLWRYHGTSFVLA